MDTLKLHNKRLYKRIDTLNVANELNKIGEGLHNEKIRAL